MTNGFALYYIFTNYNPYIFKIEVKYNTVNFEIYNHAKSNFGLQEDLVPSSIFIIDTSQTNFIIY